MKPVTGLLAGTTDDFCTGHDAPASYSLLFQSIPVMALDNFEINVILQRVPVGVGLLLQIVFPLRGNSLKTDTTQLLRVL